MTTILLIQLFHEPPLGISSLEVKLSRHYGSQLVALDSFSDSSNLAYVRKMIEESEQITAIIWEQEGGTLKGLQPIFNALLKKKQVVSLFTNSHQNIITKMTSTITSRVVKDENELLERISR